MLRVLAQLIPVCILAVAVGCSTSDPASEKKPTKTPAQAPAAAGPPTAAQNPAGLQAVPTDPAAPDPAAPAAAPSGLVPKLEALADEACKCKSADCANTVQDKVQALLQEAKEPSKEEAAQMGTIMQKAQGCIAKAQG